MNSLCVKITEKCIFSDSGKKKEKKSRSRFESQFFYEHGTHVPVEQDSTLLSQHQSSY